MSAASNYLETAIINSIIRGIAFTVPGEVYVALHTADPTETGTVGEVTTGDWPDYVRIDSTLGSGTLAEAWTAPTDGVSKNTKQLIWPVQNGSASVVVTHFSLRTAATGGEMITYAALDTARTMQPGDVFVANVNRLEVQVL